MPATAADHRCSLIQLEQALDALDARLQDTGLTLTLRAIGGFALMKHGIRAEDRAFTVDIDTLTEDASPAITALIHEVAAELGLERDWINNDAALDGDDPELTASIYDARWVATDVARYRAIDLQIADVPTLIRAKIIAADVAELSGREQDVPDLLELLHHQGITSYARFVALYPDPFGETETAHEIVRRHLTR